MKKLFTKELSLTLLLMIPVIFIQIRGMQPNPRDLQFPSIDQVAYVLKTKEIPHSQSEPRKASFTQLKEALEKIYPGHKHLGKIAGHMVTLFADAKEYFDQGGHQYDINGYSEKPNIEALKGKFIKTATEIQKLCGDSKWQDIIQNPRNYFHLKQPANRVNQPVMPATIPLDKDNYYAERASIEEIDKEISRIMTERYKASQNGDTNTVQYLNNKLKYLTNLLETKDSNNYKQRYDKFTIEQLDKESSLLATQLYNAKQKGNNTAIHQIQMQLDYVLNKLNNPTPTSAASLMPAHEKAYFDKANKKTLEIELGRLKEELNYAHLRYSNSLSRDDKAYFERAQARYNYVRNLLGQ